MSVIGWSQRKLIDKISDISIAYLLLSMIEFFIWIFASLIVNDNSNWIVADWGLITVINLVVICPCFLVLVVIVVAIKLKDRYFKKKGTTDPEDIDRGIGKGNTLATGLVVYLVASVLALAITSFLASIVNDKSSSFYTFWGPLSTFNLCCFAPCILIAMVVFGVVKLNVTKAQRKEAAEANGAMLQSQKLMGTSPISEPAIRKDGIGKAEEDREIWTLIVQLKESNLDSRKSAARGLRNYNTPEVEEALTKAMLEDDDESIRFEAYLALKYQGKDKTSFLLERLKATSDTKAMLDLLGLLRKIGDEKQVDTLTYLYGFETEKAVKLSILESLSKFYSPGIRDLAISVLRKEDDAEVRLRVLDALCWYDDGSTQEALKHLMGDPDNNIRDRADKMLKAIELREL